MFNRYIVICNDGSREEVIAESYEEKAERGGGVVVTLKPDSSYRDNQQGIFYSPQGIHRIERDVALPEGGATDDEEEDES